MKKVFYRYFFAIIVLFSAGCSCVAKSGTDSVGVANSESDESSQATAIHDPVFSVGENRTVCFSHGNLQYNKTTGSWRFAEKQYDYVGYDIDEKAAAAGWMDLFEWDTVAGGVDMEDGVKWRLLTKDEWEYLFREREDANLKYGAATVDGRAGLVVLPDRWEGDTIVPGCGGNAGYDYGQNRYTAKQWASMESNGAVFLPAVGNRFEDMYYDACMAGYYWLATRHDEGQAWYMYFYGDGEDVNKCQISFGQSVRLVRDCYAPAN